jgi:hypothetical protein
MIRADSRDSWQDRSSMSHRHATNVTNFHESRSRLLAHSGSWPLLHIEVARYIAVKAR